MWIALNRPAAWSQMPEIPTTRPKSFNAVAAVTRVPGQGAQLRASALPGPPDDGPELEDLRRLAGRVVHGVLRPAAVWPRLFVPVAKPCVPPSVGSGVITPFCHRKPRQRLPRPVALGKKKPQLHFSLYGSGSFVCAIPLTIPRMFFTGQSTALFAPPSVSRSVSAPFRHSVACRIWLPGRLERPATQPRSLTLNPTLDVPPSESRLSRR